MDESRDETKPKVAVSPRPAAVQADRSTVRTLASGAAGAARSAASDVGSTANAVADQAGKATDGLIERAREGSNQLVEEVRVAANQMIDEQKGRAADAVKGVADALRQTAGTLNERDATVVAHYADRAAEEVERLSEAVRNRTVSSLVADTEHFARRQPQLFLAGAAAAGFVLGRFIRASGEREAALASGDFGRERR